MSLRAKIVSALVVIGIAIPAAAHSAHERKIKALAEREMAAFANMVEPITIAAGSERSVTLNGAQLYFKKTTEQGTLDEVMARVANECASGKQAGAFGIASEDRERSEKTIRLERVFSQEADSGAVRASLCIFANDDPGAEERDELRRVRYTLAHRRDDGSIAVTTVVNATSTPLQELFPADGDAPGSDLPEIARPAESKRTMTAIVGKNEHAVRVYESSLSLADAVASYDAQMKVLGFATTGALDDARMYRKDGKSYVASFRATTGGSAVALMPFGTAAGKTPSN